MKSPRSMPTNPAPRTRIDPARVLVRDVMQADVLVFRPDDSIQSAAEQLEEIGASGAPVVDDAGRLIGVLTTADIARSEHVDGGRISTRLAAAFEPDAASTSDAAGFDEEVLPTPAFGELLAGRARIADWMTPGVTSVAPDATLAHACRVMIDENIHRVFVVDGELLVGVVSTKDVVRLLATPQPAR